MMNKIDHIVTVWKVDLNQQNPDIYSYFRFISDFEIEKARRFYFEKDQRRYIQSHAILRKILGDLLGVSPREVKFFTNPFGKPYVGTEPGQFDVYFNISHSQSGLLISISEGVECGVDLEYQRDDFPSSEIAEHFFSKNELQTYLALPAYQKKEAFFNCWTRKEAFIKAKGKGLTIPLDSFDVSLIPGETARLLKSYLVPDDTENWSLLHLDTWQQYSSALCVQQNKFGCVIKEWS